MPPLETGKKTRKKKISTRAPQAKQKQEAPGLEQRGAEDFADQ